MKTYRNYLLGINIALLMIIAVGCNEYTTKTKINADGSCQRTVTVEGEISNIAEAPFPIPTDKSWNILTKKSEKDSSKNIYTASKSFNSVEDLSKEYKSPNKIQVQIKFEKKFRWFYTYYEYEETYKSFFPYKSIPLNKYLSVAEYKSYLDGDTSKTLEDKLEKYSGENYLEYFLTELIKESRKNGIGEINEASIKKNRSLISEHIDHSDNTDELVLFLQNIFKNKKLFVLKPFLEKITKEIDKNLEWVSSAEGTYTNQINMPGIILTTNSKSVTGNNVEWKLDAKRFQFEDMKMMVESRTANVSMFIITGILIAFALAMLLVPKFRKTPV